MANLQEISGYLPQWAQEYILEAGNSTYSDHLWIKRKRLEEASERFPYGVFNPEFINVSATADIIGVSAVNRPPNERHPNERTDLLIQYLNDIGNIYTQPTSASPQPTNLGRIKETPDGKDTHLYPIPPTYIKSWEVITELWHNKEDEI